MCQMCLFEIVCLGKIDSTWSWHDHSEHRRDERAAQYPMCDTLFEEGLRREIIIQMHRVFVPADFRERAHVFIADPLGHGGSIANLYFACWIVSSLHGILEVSWAQR